MSNEARGDSMGEAPGSERSYEEERLFVLALRKDDRRFCFYEGHKGLGNSQKAEVAWLEEMGCAYEEVAVRDFPSATSAWSCSAVWGGGRFSPHRALGV
jgi:hypothetical protein